MDSLWKAWLLGLLLGCGSASEAPAVTAAALVPEPAIAPAEAPVAEVESPEALAPIDLLHAVPTELGVSTVYRGHPTQAARMLDGDPETAWNSATGDLVGAWIEVRVPEGARVTGAEIIVGFTHENAGRDLFVANTRVTGMAVSVDGERIGSFALDAERRDLQPIVFEGGGGVYRFEVTEVLAGSNPNWREICLAEFRLMGTTPNPIPGQRPRVGVGALPDHVLPPDRETLVREHAPQTTDFLDQWFALESLVQRELDYSSAPQLSDADEARLTRMRGAALTHLADYVVGADPATSNALLAAADASVEWRSGRARSEARMQDLDLVTRAFEAVGDHLESDEARCRAAQTLAAVRLRRLRNASQAALMFVEMDDSEQMMMGGEIDDAQQVRGSTIEEAAERFEAADAHWRRSAASTATQLVAMSPPPVGSEDFVALRTQIDAARASCDW